MTTTGETGVTDLDRLQQDLAAAQGVRYFFGAYVDVHGVPKSKCVPIAHLEDAAARVRALHRRRARGHGRARPERGRVRRRSRTSTSSPCCRGTAGTRSRRPTCYFHGEPYTHDFAPRAAAPAGRGGRTRLPDEHGRGARGVRAARDRGRRSQPWVAEDTAQRADAGLRPRDDDAGRRVPRADGRATSTSSAGTCTRSTTRAATASTSSTSATPTRSQMADRMLVFRLMAKHVARTLGLLRLVHAQAVPATGFGVRRAPERQPRRPRDRRERCSTTASPATRARRRQGHGYSDARLPVHRGRAGARAALIGASLCPTVNSYKRLMPARVHAARSPGRRCTRPGAQQPHADVPAADEPALPRAPHRRQRGQLLPRHGAGAGGRPGGHPRELEPGDPVNADTYKMMRGPTWPRPACAGCRGRSARRSTRSSTTSSRARCSAASSTQSYASYKRGEWEEYNTVVTEWEREQYLRLW